MGNKTWPTGIRPCGKGLRIKIWRGGRLAFSQVIECDPYKAADVAAAVKRRDALLARQKLGLPLRDGDEAPRRLFGEVAQDYLDTLDVKYSTMKSYFTILNTYWWPEFGRWPVDEVTTPAIKRALARLDLTSKTKRNLLIVLRGVLAHAEVNPNPVDAIRHKRDQRPPVERFTREEQDALMARLEGQAAVYFSLLFGCGLRPGEALALRWEDYDGEELHIHKQITRRRVVTSTKTSVARRVYVPKWVRPYLNNHATRFSGGWMFQTGKGTPHLDTDVFNGAWKRAHGKRPQIRYRIPYTCRHTRAAELLSMGIDAADAAAQMGHSPEIFLRTYAEFMEDRARLRDKSRFDPDRQNTDNGAREIEPQR